MSQEVSLQNWEKKALSNRKKYEHFIKRADKKRTLQKLPQLHKTAFKKIDCLDCAACCKNYSPRFTGPDIRRIAGRLKMKETVFISTYLFADADGDYVLQKKPCSFLGEDNFCSIYEDRPKDCRRFPYTDEDVLLKRPAITIKNSTFCPAVYYVLERLTSEV